MKLKSTFLSLLLIVAMAVTMLPAIVFATGEEQEGAQYGLNFEKDTLDLLAVPGRRDTDSNRAYLLKNGESLASDEWSVVWMSNNPSIATVSEYEHDSGSEDSSAAESYTMFEDGQEQEQVTTKEIKIHGVSVGNTTITATAKVGDEVVDTASFTVRVLAPETIALGQTKAVVKDIYEVFYSFTPDKTSHYVFYSRGSGNQYDPDADIYTSDGSEYSFDDDDPYSYRHNDDDRNDNFEVSFVAEAGKTYYLRSHNCDYSSSSGGDGYTVGIRLGEQELKKEAKALLEEANALQASKYTTASFAPMNKAKQYLENLLEDEDASQKQIDKAAQNLKATMDNLKAKAANTLQVNSKNKKYKVAKLRSKKSFKAITIKNPGQGELTYTVTPANKKSKNALKFNSKTGKVTVKKKTKKGTYKVVIIIKTAGDDMHLPGEVTKVITVKVKK